MKGNDNGFAIDDWEERDLTVGIPLDRDTFSAGEVAKMLRVSRDEVIKSMRASEVAFSSRLNNVPMMDATSMLAVVRSFKASRKVS